MTVMDEKSLPFLRVSWEPPHKADTRSGWITLIYELRVKLEGVEEWEVLNLFFKFLSNQSLKPCVDKALCAGH